MKGRVFAIEEFSTYDGPGIRMTVFLKGCPLKCMWCHNPEGQSFESELVRSPNGCLECFACLREGEKRCGKPCLVNESIEVCPRRLIRISGEDYTPTELVAKIEKNLDILNMSGGGVTFSGGEPLSHWKFVIECAELLHGKTSIALQTSGYAEPMVFEHTLDAVDTVLFDLKLMDSEKHRYFTGVANEKILQNYRVAAKSGKRLITRIPLIPTVNDTVENLEATAAFMKSLDVKYMELLPYNKMAGGKYLMLGRKYEPEFDGEREPSVHREIFDNYGIEVKIL